MRMALLAALLVGCGSAEAASIDARDAGVDSAAAGTSSCDWCPGNAQFTTYDGGGATMGICYCPLPSTPDFISRPDASFQFEIDPPLARCAYVQCMHAHWIDGGCAPLIQGQADCGRP